MLANPISSEMSHMRPQLLPGLLQAAARNQARGLMDQALFEVGTAFHGGEPGEQHVQVSGLIVGRTGPKDVHGASRAVDVFDAKADAEAFLAAIGAPAKVQIMRGADAWWHPGVMARFALARRKSWVSLVKSIPRFWPRWTSKGLQWALPFGPPRCPCRRRSRRPAPPLVLRDLQAVERDFAFVVDADVEALTLVNAAAGADKALIETVRVFDEFIGGRWVRERNPSP